LHLGVCDLSDLASVRQFAGRFRDQASRLDVLVNNAGVMTEAREVSADGIELTFATNVVGPFLLTNLLIPLLQETAPARIINVSSGGMYTQKLRADDPESERGETVLRADTTAAENAGGGRRHDRLARGRRRTCPQLRPVLAGPPTAPHALAGIEPGDGAEREQLPAECVRLSGWRDPSAPAASIATPEREP
jgi:hypothetical protein